MEKQYLIDELEDVLYEDDKIDFDDPNYRQSVIEYGLNKVNNLKKNCMRKVEVIGYKIAKETYHEFESLTHAAKHCKAAVESIYLVCQGKFKQTKGWCFVYKSENFAEEIQCKLSQQTTRGKSSCKK